MTQKRDKSPEMEIESSIPKPVNMIALSFFGIFYFSNRPTNNVMYNQNRWDLLSSMYMVASYMIALLAFTVRLRQILKIAIQTKKLVTEHYAMTFLLLCMAIQLIVSTFGAVYVASDLEFLTKEDHSGTSVNGGFILVGYFVILFSRDAINQVRKSFEKWSTSTKGYTHAVKGSLQQ